MTIARFVLLASLLPVLITLVVIVPRAIFPNTILSSTPQSEAQSILGTQKVQDPLAPYLNQAYQMTLKEKVRQVLICGYQGTDINNALIKSGNCGNFLLFKENVRDITPEKIKTNNDSVHQYDPLTWMMIDQEGGTIARLKDGSPSPKEMAETDTVGFWGDSQGKLLNNLGFDVNLAPVADISHHSPVIKNRSFTDDPATTSLFVTEYLAALQNNGVWGTLKHLPGHGRVLVDTHSETGTLDYSWDEIIRTDLLPFVEAIHKGARIALVGHIIIPELDTKPASISPTIISKLRDYLPKGREIIFISDSLIMKGVGLSMDKSPIAALQAGLDMLIINGFPEQDTFNSIVKAYEDKSIDIEKLNLSVARILYTKSHLPEHY